MANGRAVEEPRNCDLLRISELQNPNLVIVAFSHPLGVEKHNIVRDIMMYKHMPLKENNMNQLINLMFIKLYRDSTPSIPKVKNFGDVVQIDQKNSNIK